jgi:hypothetical protein
MPSEGEVPAGRSLAVPSAERDTDMVETAPFIEGIRDDLHDATSGDETSAAVAENLGRAIASSLQLRLLDVFGEAALELSEAMPEGHVEVRLVGRDVQLVYVGDEPGGGAAPPAEDGHTARLTLRMPGSLKSRVEIAAGGDGISTNTWLVRAVTRDLDRPHRRRAGNRLTGFAQG